MPDDAQPGVSRDRRPGICTLFERDYHFGLAAFLNSLVHADYAGTVWAGYRGPLPPWLDQLRKTTADKHEYAIAGRIRLIFVPVLSELHLTNFKPRFMLDLLSGPAGDCEYLWYFDPDICLKSSWTTFAKWQRHGIALGQEIVDNILPEDAPLRREWMEIASTVGLKNPRPLHHYYNGGMLGIAAGQTSFLEAWQRLIEYAGSAGYDLRGMMP